MAGFWSERAELPRKLSLIARTASILALVAALASPTGAAAQSKGPDENVNAGKITQLALTEAQKMAIYKAVLQDHARRTTSVPGTVTATVGAPVAPVAELAPLPDQAARQADAGLDLDLKYAMVDNDIVVVDPVGMRVIDVIHGNVIP
ncbi:MAG TPA: hypothetical protein VH206_10705 [Xanthobacteraceae bacterium]|jgi:hypothetical protein|nr:hypothetical protein [Xanthobacteraceae bacterium]